MHYFNKFSIPFSKAAKGKCIQVSLSLKIGYVYLSMKYISITLKGATLLYLFQLIQKTHSILNNFFQILGGQISAALGNYLKTLFPTKNNFKCNSFQLQKHQLQKLFYV